MDFIKNNGLKREVVMKRYKIGSFLLITCLLMSLLTVQGIAANGYSTISGIISLPGDDVAPSGGVKVLLIVETDNNTPNNKNDDKSVSTELTIPKGRNSIAYSIQVPKSQNSKAKYSVYYTVGNGYAPFGWYNKDQTTAIKDNRTLVDLNSGDVKGIDIELLEGKSISGKIILGNQSTKPLNDLKYTVTAVQEGSNPDSSDDDIIISKEVAVKANSSEAAYELIVPINSVRNGYKVYYTFENQGYVENGYYYKNGTSRSSSKVTLIDVANTVKNIDLTTLPFTNITGKVYLPNNEKATGNGIEVTVTAYNNNSKATAADDFSFSKTVKIPKDSGSASYALTIPVSSTDYIISYKIITKNAKYINEGYYNKGGTGNDIKNATPVKTGNKNTTGIDIEIISKKAEPTPTPAKPAPETDAEIIEKYDLNEDGYVNVFDLIDLAKVIIDQYEKEGFDRNLEQYKNRRLDESDLEIIRKVFRPFTNNRYKLKWFDSINKWFDFDFDFDWEEWEDWFEKNKNFDCNDWKELYKQKNVRNKK